MRKLLGALLFTVLLYTAAGAFALNNPPKATPSPILAATGFEPAGEDTLLLSFVGDVSIGDIFSNRNGAKGYHGTVAEKGYAWPFSLVKNVLETDDMTVANLEVVLTERTKHVDKRVPLIASPAQVEVLRYSGIDMLNTMNNHAFDFFEAGYRDTLSTLDAAGIPHFGTVFNRKGEGMDLTSVYETKGIKIGLIGISYPQNQDVKRIAARVKTLRESGCGLVIVSLHWGREEQPLPNVGQYSYARSVIDAGADVVYGHHPHVIQPIHMYKGKPIFYSTGNFTFGSMSRVDPDTGIFQLRYSISEGSLKLSNLTVIPCRTQGSGDYRPYILTEEKDRQAVFRKLTFKKAAKGMDNLPESFLETGSADFE